MLNKNLKPNVGKINRTLGKKLLASLDKIDMIDDVVVNMVMGISKSVEILSRRCAQI